MILSCYGESSINCRKFGYGSRMAHRASGGFEGETRQRRSVWRVAKVVRKALSNKIRRTHRLSRFSEPGRRRRRSSCRKEKIIFTAENKLPEREFLSLILTREVLNILYFCLFLVFIRQGHFVLMFAEELSRLLIVKKRVCFFERLVQQLLVFYSLRFFNSLGELCDPEIVWLVLYSIINPF